MLSPVVGIIANPASGKDIRRLVAFGSVYDNQEKINCLIRILRGLDALGIRQVNALAEPYGLVNQAHDQAQVGLRVDLLEMPMTRTAQDSTEAARLMSAQGVECIITLGGDGTNRAVAKGCGNVPLLPISTGTNNVFPTMVEGTLAGVAAAAVVLKVQGIQDAIQPTSRLEIMKDGQVIDIALVDAVVYDDMFVASRAIWDPDKILSVILVKVKPSTLGTSSIANCLPDSYLDGNDGICIEVGGSGPLALAPIAPGIILPIPIRSVTPLAAGQRVTIQHAPAVLALDGEREVLLRSEGSIEVRLNANGPRVVQVEAALDIARKQGLFLQAKRR